MSRQVVAPAAGLPFGQWNMPNELWDVERCEQARYDYHGGLARLSPRGQLRIVDISEHGMTAFAPDLVAQTLIEIVRTARR